jgi:hypothetical protein
MASWDSNLHFKNMIYGNIEPSVDLTTFVKQTLSQHYSTDDDGDILVQLRKEKDFEDIDGENTFVDEKVISLTYGICKGLISEKLDEISLTLKSVEDTFIEVNLDMQIAFVENDSDVRSDSFNLMVANLLALVDEDMAHHEEIDDDTFRSIFANDEVISELELLEEIYNRLEDFNNVLEPWKDQIEELEITGVKQAKNLLLSLHSNDSSDDHEMTLVKAEVKLWPIIDFITKAQNGKLDIDPIYQRTDVWSNTEAVSLIRSILRGIPLPSVILWENEKGRYQVIDGKQRITSILRFYGAHPTGLKFLESKVPQLKKYLIDELSTKYKYLEEAIDALTQEQVASIILGHTNPALKKMDIPNIGKWGKNKHYGPVTEDEEDKRKRYLPIKLDKKLMDSGEGLLRDTCDKYYWEIKDIEVSEGVTIDALFTSTGDYRIPVIIFDRKTSPNQIRQVFKLYNSTGKKLNPTEQNNAAYQDQLSLKLLLALCKIRPERGDELFADFDEISYSSVEAYFDKFTFIEDFAIRDTRFNTVKVLSWVMSFLFQDSRKDNGEVSTLSTTNFIESFFENAGQNSNFTTDIFTDAIGMLTDASTFLHSNDEKEIIDVLQEYPKFTNKGRIHGQWDELASVSIMVGVCLVVQSVENWKKLVEDEEIIANLTTYMEAQKLPPKQQTKDQWIYFANKITGFCEVFGLNKDNLDRSKFMGNNVLQNLSDFLDSL